MKKGIGKMINELMSVIHNNALDKGFWDDQMKINDVDFDGNIKLLESTHVAFITQKIMLIVAEISESIESLRDNKFAMSEDVERLVNNFDKDQFKEKVKDTFQDEIADTVIRIFDLAEYMGIDLESHIKLKMEYNSTRPHKHGRNF